MHKRADLIRMVVPIFVLFLLMAFSVSYPSFLSGAEPQGGAVTPAPASPSQGERLFTGIIGFQNGGPPCMACHNVSGLPFPGGGTVGPDLTGISKKYGPALANTLATLPFPTMVPIFGKRPLAQAEQQDLAAFFGQKSGASGPNSSLKIFLPGIGGLILLMAVIGVVWRRRLRTVRERLVKSGGSRS